MARKGKSLTVGSRHRVETIVRTPDGTEIRFAGTDRNGNSNPLEWRAEKTPEQKKSAAILKSKSESDFAITEFEGGKRKYAFVRDNRTGQSRWISEKENQALRKAGKTFVTDF